MRPIHINKKVAKTTFQIDNCGNVTEATIEITRVGGSDTIVYPSLEMTADKVTFMWDDALYKARSGRYQGLSVLKAVSLSACRYILAASVISAAVKTVILLLQNVWGANNGNKIQMAQRLYNELKRKTIIN
ncbi:hypothetical protein [Rodentibacter pneumotropicus]|uniref:hypothetical protein n=1 Tax=Rodentibacter pneumotropicus TaxID=758 RepID=UPI0005EF972D|nr:hypothetical protein [Rodentibacter pneumotropicus]